jgi:preprotein translocase subunit SecG
MWLTALLIFVHVVASLILILVVLLQTGKRADLAGAFGGGGSQTAFGPRGAASVLSRTTTIAAAVFMVTSLSLAYRMGSPSDASVVGDEPVTEAPAPTGEVPEPIVPGEPTPGTAPPPVPPAAPEEGDVDADGTGAPLDVP